MHARWLIGFVFSVGIVLPVCRAVEPSASVKVVSDPTTHDTLAVIAPDGPLIHTTQISAMATEPGANTAAHVVATLHGIDKTIRTAGGDPKQVIKLNVVANTQATAEVVRGVIRKHFAGGMLPAVTFAIGKLPDPRAVIAIDAVAIGAKPFARTKSAALLPSGPRAYISGQAEKGTTVAEATAKTLKSLGKTLEFLGAKPADVIQAKCFLTPMSAAADVVCEFGTVFGANSLPIVFVEWDRTSVPIEIELIVRCPAGAALAANGGPIEFLTPTGLSASPVFARVTRVNSPRVIYVSGLVSPKPGTGAEEVTELFGQLSDVLSKSGSDLRHLVKATYLVSGDDVSGKLNELRPRFYDPRRPPAASKAMVPEVAAKDRSIVVDLIAVPKP